MKRALTLHSGCAKAGICSPGFTLIELLIVVGIITILAVLSMPTFKNVLSGSKLAKCSSNMREWGMGFQMYMNDHDGFLPQQAEHLGDPDSNWQELIAPYVTGGEKIWNFRNALRARFRCPGDKTTGIVYGSTHYLSPLRYNKAPAKLISLNQKLSDFLLLGENYTGEFWDTRPDGNPAAGGRIDYNRHSSGKSKIANFLFADFHVEPLSYQQTLDRPVVVIP
jgi:prepilin-type N-terminal cleavage/methylation domain-containing protein/prepilin-type processing-associated H-X9-DG protein